MAIAAVPAYLGKDFSQASPGLRFGMYLPLWGMDARTGECLWTTHDLNQRTAGQQRELREFKDENKTSALKQALALNKTDLDTMQALARRQSALACALAERGLVLSIEARAVAPFTTGLGNEHPLENGFAFLNPYGLPYLPGSGVKGVLRQSARELASGEWGARQGWDDAAIDALFGKAGDDGDTDHQRGALNCWDVIPQLAGEALQVEVMTPHQTHYYQKGDTPHESGQPNPINFLTVPPGAGFAFHLQCDVSFLARLAPELAVDARWQVLVQAALAHAFAWLGFGAKTAVGYGAMTEDEQARQRREVERAATLARATEQARAQRLASLSPEDQAWDLAQPVLEAFLAAFNKARPLPFSPSGPFNQTRLEFMKVALAWREARSRAKAGELLSSSATKAWGRPSNKDRWTELQQAIAALKGET